MPSVVLTSRAAWRALTLAVVALVLFSLGAGPAAAHNALRSTDPADGSTVATAPAQVTLTFDQAALELGTQVVVTGPDGQVVSDGPAQLVDTSVVQPLVATLPAGAYSVDWRVTSADGHPLSGAFTFTATQAVGGAPAAEPTPEPTEDPAASDDVADATPEPSDAPADDATLTAPPSSAPVDDGGVPAWVWVLLGAGALGAVVAALVVAGRRGDAAGAPTDPDAAAPTDPDATGPTDPDATPPPSGR